MDTPHVIVVMLRSPKRTADESRDDPFWEFGSFGCTRCHRRNLLNPRRSNELRGARFAFVQGGDDGWRLVHVTPPISVRSVGDISEAFWSPTEMPLTYASAPTIIDNCGRSDVPLLANMARTVSRPTPVSRFASLFRSRRRPLAGEVSAQVLSTYQKFRDGFGRVAMHYEEAMPYPPPRIEKDRAFRYEWILSLRRAENRP